jgi:diguanylate cyclase (GGDEF)-like protein
MWGTMGEAHLPVPVSAYGPLIPLSLRVHRMSHTGHAHEAIDAADAYIRLARAAGDEKTVSFLIQGRMYAHLMLGGYEEALRAGEELLRRHLAAKVESERALAEAELVRDPLTGLGNRRTFDRIMNAIDTGTLPGPTVLLLIDVDEFKAINDAYSHSSGDRVLVEIARILRAHCRAEDVPARFAGDEFTVFLRAGLSAGRDAAERIRSAVAAADFSAMTPGTAVSISAGVAALRPGMTGRDLFQEADRRLYQAKRDGRDRVSA